MNIETCNRVEAVLNQWLRVCYLHNRDGVPSGGPWIDGLPQCAGVIAAEIDRLTAERDEARAEVERFRPAAEAWKAREAQRIAFETFDRDPTPGNHDALTGANMAMLGTGLRARAAKEAKP